MSGALGVIVVESVALSFAVFPSPPPLTVTEFDNGVEAFAATEAVTVIEG
jgi:hypothetical protein